VVRGYIGKPRSKGSFPLILDWGMVTEVDPETGEVRKRRKLKMITFRGTKREAQAKLSELVAAANKGEYVEPSKMLFAEWLDEWLNTLRESGKRSLRTIETYESDIRKHIKPKLGNIRLQELTPTDIQRYYNRLPLSQATKERHHAITSGALKMAASFGYVVRNVAQLVPEKPSRNDAERRTDAIEHCWSREEAQRFLRALKDEPLQTQAFYTLALQTGMRKGELCGLKWEDFDPKNRTLIVQRNLVRAGSEPVFGPPKNKRTRTLGLDPSTVKLLLRHKAEQNRLKLANPHHYRDFGLIFAKDWHYARGRAFALGEPLSLSHIGERDFDPLIKKAGVKRIKFHGLRHTAATLALLDGMPVHVVAEMLGHKDATETVRTYAHVIPSARQEAAQRMAAILGRQ